ncbi:pseudouridine synthase [Enterococcus timonensis]|uniref:pseudouridine synthase n=1 Tax=Enterococcus timonensis TaxID=1852364 RepID=UPI0008DAB2AD|nr:pseudouridine synthase [Enterococcus timonensis]
MRLDRFLTETKVGSRSEVKKFIKKGQVTVNGQVEKNIGAQIDENNAQVEFQGEKLHYEKFVYYLLHKPQGVVSATKDAQKTVLDLLLEKDQRGDIFPVGRLDKDTEGLLLLTNDGKLAHDLLSPKKHVEKEYFAKINGLVTEETIAFFAGGMTLKEDENISPSQLKIVAVDQKVQTSEILLIIHEGKFHQVKRMFHKVGMEVTYLKRVRMGTLTLGQLAQGQYRVLSEKEMEPLKNN